MSAGTPLAIGVFPAAEHNRRPRLLAALEEAFPVHFKARGDEGELGGLDAVLEFGRGVAGAGAATAGLPALSLLAEEPFRASRAVPVELADGAELERPLRGAELPDDRLRPALAGAATIAADGGEVLARADGQPTWVRAGLHRTGLLAPAELGPEEALRERLRDGRSAALLPLAHFLREVAGARAWQPPPLRAALLFDDPNLHWPSYGFLHLGALARHAREHGYHAALATVPLDSWFAHPKATEALRESAGSISLLVHGNDHFGAELGRVETEADAVATAAQALRRVRDFELRHGVRVEPLMVPPHEECSRATVRGLRRCGFEAITMTRPYPWLSPPPRSWLTRPESAGPLAGWHPADLAEGLPVLLRHPFAGRSRAELALRAFLGQPLILYGHQADVAPGLDVLAEAAADVDRLGDARWCSLGEVAAANFEQRRAGARLALRPFGLRTELTVPPGVEELTVEPPPGAASATTLLLDGAPHGFGEPAAVIPGAKVELRLSAADAVDLATVPAPPRQPLALPRRLASEGRDRLLPLLARAR